jgi:hypothetical protein
MPAAALRALLEQAIDYAGLFPPAGLALETALQNFAAYLDSDESWMLGAFVLPLRQFSAAADLLPSLKLSRPLRVSALAPKDSDGSDLEKILGEMRHAIAGSARDGKMTVSQAEILWPKNGANDSLGANAESLGNAGVKIFWEAPAVSAAETIASLAGHADGFKLRTGGLTADAFPSDELIARALVATARHCVPIKFTAGLHHPVKNFHSSVQTKMPGFLNVLGAGVLALEHRWDEAQTAQIIAEEDAAAFVFDEENFRWRDWKIATAQIKTHRRFVTSLGSCSFDEPRDDLRALGLL